MGRNLSPTTLFKIRDTYVYILWCGGRKLESISCLFQHVSIRTVRLRGTSSTREAQGHTGSRLAGQKHVGIFTNDRVEADPAVQPIDRWNILVLA